MMRYCGHAGQLAWHYQESSVYTKKGDAFHLGAHSAEEGNLHPNLNEMYEIALRVLDDKTRSEVADMLGRWIQIRQEIAPEKIECEITLTLDREGLPCDPETPGALPGHSDVCWIEEVYKVDNVGKTPMRLASCGDHKTGMERDYSLQLKAYAITYAAMRGASHFRWTPIYHKAGKDPEFHWSPIVAVDSPEAEAIWKEIKSAWESDTYPCVGPHCSGCFQRSKCTAWMGPPLELAADALRPFLKGSSEGLTHSNAPRALRVYQAMGDVMKLAKAQLETFADTQGGIVDGDKVWQGKDRDGNTRVDLDALRRDGLYEKYAIKGRPYREFSWGKKR